MIDFDAVTDCLIVQRDGAAIVKARPSPHDNHLVLELDAAGAAVGFLLMSASVRILSAWRAHPDRDLLPPDLLVQVDAWLEQRTPSP